MSKTTLLQGCLGQLTITAERQSPSCVFIPEIKNSRRGNSFAILANLQRTPYGFYSHNQLIFVLTGSNQLPPLQ